VLGVVVLVVVVVVVVVVVFNGSDVVSLCAFNRVVLSVP